MQTDKEKIQISISELARTLGWPITTASSIKSRKSPKEKYKKLMECEQKLIEAREEIQRKMQTDTNQ